MKCPYKSLFGDPNTGVHSTRVFGLAAVDVGATIAAAAIISVFSKIHFVKVLLVLVILGIVLHRFFCVNTTVNVLFFGKV